MFYYFAEGALKDFSFSHAPRSSPAELQLGVRFITNTVVDYVWFRGFPWSKLVWAIDERPFP
ncbi:hypothetical protein PLUTE_a5015 [Pseudoalteromonas luteoviolacea DSM 6061]|nr:hypothetical protein [Pseudoalteromonas luteoviolacea DSM 6061]